MGQNGTLNESESMVYIYDDGEWKPCDIKGEKIWMSEESAWYKINKNGKEIYIYN